MGIHWRDLIVSALLMAAGVALLVTLIWSEGEDDETDH